MILARALFDNLSSESQATLLWITEWGVWPSGEHAPLAESVRRDLGADRPMAELPAHLIARSEVGDGLSIACIAILFVWDMWLVSESGDQIAFLSHDEVGYAVGYEDTDLPNVLQHLRLVPTSAI